MWLPLNTPLPSMRAEGRFVPLQTFGVMSGVIMARYHKVTDSIEIYMGAASWSNVVGPNEKPTGPLTKPALYVGPFADQRPVPSDGRVGWALKVPPELQPMAEYLRMTFSTLPADYTHFGRNQSGVCPDARLQSVQAQRAAVDWKKMAWGQLDAMQTQEAIRVVEESADCHLSWLRGSPSDGHAYGILESALHVTSVMESAGFHVPLVNWNDFDVPGSTLADWQ